MKGLQLVLGFFEKASMTDLNIETHQIEIYFNMVDIFFVHCGPLGNCIARSLAPIYTLEFLLFMQEF